MAIVFHENEISLEYIGTAVTVPNNDVARLMYYLNCVCVVIDCSRDPEIQRFTNYQKWYYLSRDEQKQLLLVCYTFSPDVFNNRIFFHSDELCNENSNEFYTINQVRQQLLAADSIVIAGKIREVHKIMTYTMQWMRKFYIKPIARLAQELNTSRPSISSTYTSTYTPNVIQQPTKDISSKMYSACCCICTVVYCILCVTPPIVFVLIIVISK
ncbi:unnamed protein product [Adineta steineri]|uniref:Uncharacterized protein n=1 Tax=Adineta steineri TaxID=433720 RepID=A0A814PCU5_9BILA|nr:unnamed protein product [Adineta steineri]CAF1106151.1 unnamed protein product [Adineta steineri]CAF1208837.1 unnamed protein product [Adineta steineri]